MSRVRRCRVMASSDWNILKKLHLPFFSTKAIVVNKEYIHSFCVSNVSDSCVNCFCCFSVASLSCCWSCSTVSWRRDTIAVNTLTSLSPSSWQWPVVHWHTTGAGWTTQATTTTASSETGHTDVHIVGELRRYD